MPNGVRLAEIGSGVLLATDVKLDEGDTRVSLLSALMSHTIQVTRPIIQGGREVGRITLVSDNSGLMPSLLAVLMQTLLGALASLAVAVLVASRLQQWVVRPLIRLTETVGRISQSHDYSTRVEIETNDEVGDLCGGFNAMLSEIKVREAKIVDLAFHDAETDLANRLAFEREISARLNDESGLAVLVVGVDRFQYVRGVIGYHLANDLLSELGARLTEFGADGVAARVSTDAIGFLIDNGDLEEVRSLAESILAEIETPMLIGVNTIDINASIGIAVTGVHAGAAQQLIECANVALDQARANEAKIAFFDKDAYGETTHNLSLMTDMMRALRNGEMAIALQPKYDVRSSRIGGAEVLARWTHPTRGSVSPDLFIGMAEETGAIGPLTLWALRQAIACQGRLAEAHLEPSLAVNLSGRLLGDSAFIDAAVELLDSARGPLTLEITETADIGDQEVALKHIEVLVAAGAYISIDDYGSGLSSLAYLKRIPAHELKIDKVFIQALGEQQRDALLVKSTIDLAHSLGMKITAEGVETDIAFTVLVGMGCDTIQGYLTGRPMPEKDYVAVLRGSGESALASPPHALAAG
jgi:diguanylate cyclase (GGDEF)-like protein